MFVNIRTPFNKHRIGQGNRYQYQDSVEKQILVLGQGRETDTSIGLGQRYTLVLGQGRETYTSNRIGQGTETSIRIEQGNRYQYYDRVETQILVLAQDRDTDTSIRLGQRYTLVLRQGRETDTSNRIGQGNRCQYYDRAETQILVLTQDRDTDTGIRLGQRYTHQ